MRELGCELIHTDSKTEAHRLRFQLPIRKILRFELVQMNIHLWEWNFDAVLI